MRRPAGAGRAGVGAPAVFAPAAHSRFVRRRGLFPKRRAPIPPGRRSLSFALYLAAFLPLSCRERLPSIGPPDSSAVGTYELVLCRRTCGFDDSSAALIRATLVLDSTKIPVPDSQADYFAIANASAWATDLRDDHPESACFVLRETTRPPQTSHGVPLVRGVPAVAVTNWRYGLDSGLVLELYRSPDAALRMEAVVSGRQLVGRTRAAGPQGEGDIGARYVTGRRMGNPEPNVCLQAAPAHWTRDRLK